MGRRHGGKEQMMRLRVLLADATGLAGRSLETLIDGASIEIVGQSSDRIRTVELVRALKPDVAILDLGVSDVDQLDVAREIRVTSPATRIIAVEADPSEPRVLTAFQAGILGYVVRASLGGDLTRAVRDVGRGEIFLSPCASRVLVRNYL
jgi:DNA-binding NarL/FixJ family response regulator